MEGLSEQDKRLLEDLKNYLDMTFEDEGTDKKVWDSAKRGMKLIDDRAGMMQDYELDLDARDLLYNFVRYDINGVRHLFEKNFKTELLDLVLDREAGEYAGVTV